MWQENRTEAEYVNWRQGEPNNTGGNEDCVEKRSTSGLEVWNDRPCDYIAPHALCQAQK